MNVSAPTPSAAPQQQYEVKKPDPQPSTSVASQTEAKPDLQSDTKFDSKSATDSVAISSAAQSAQDQWKSTAPEKPEANTVPPAPSR